MSVKADKTIIMPIFYNEAIFDSGVDYEIGGFETNQNENITFADIYEGYVTRLSDYIDEYLDIAIDTYALQGYESPNIEGLNALGNVVQDLLKVEIKIFSKNEILNSILNSDQSQTWLNKIKDRINIFYKNISVVNEQNGIKSEINPDSELYKEAEEIMLDSSLETILERLSTIES